MLIIQAASARLNSASQNCVLEINLAESGKMYFQIGTQGRPRFDYTSA